MPQNPPARPIHQGKSFNNGLNSALNALFPFYLQVDAPTRNHNVRILEEQLRKMIMKAEVAELKEQLEGVRYEGEDPVELKKQVYIFTCVQSPFSRLAHHSQGKRRRDQQ